MTQQTKKISIVVTILIIIALVIAFNDPRAQPQQVEHRTAEVEPQRVNITSIEGPISQVAAGYGTSFALQPTGELWAWGLYFDGEGQYNTDAQLMHIPGGAAYVSAFGHVEHDMRAPLQSHAMTISTDGALWGFGANFFGQLGVGMYRSIGYPVRVMDGVTHVATGNAKTAAITSAGGLYMWGLNQSGELGFSPTIAVGSIYPAWLRDDAVSIAISHEHVLITKADNSLWGWGLYSGLGIGVTYPTIPVFRRDFLGRPITEDLTAIPDPITHKIMDNVAAAAVGGGHSLALTTGGVLYAWGRNLEGQVGSGISNHEPYPHRLPYPVMIKEGIASIITGTHNSAAITYDGELYVWGLNNSGQIGNGTNINQPTPVKIMDNVVQLAISNGIDSVHMLAITADGSLWGWGCNRFGQLGIAPDVVYMSNVPVMIRASSHSTVTH